MSEHTRTATSDAAEHAQVNASAIRTLVEMLMEEPAQMSSHAAGCFLGLCAEAEGQWDEVVAEAGPAPSFGELGFTKVGVCTCGTGAFLQERWAHFGQDGMDHAPAVVTDSIRPWPASEETDR